MNKPRKGKKVWVVGFDADRKKYVPCLHRWVNNIHEDPKEYWATLTECEDACLYMNHCKPRKK